MSKDERRREQDRLHREHTARERDEELRRRLQSELAMRRIDTVILCDRIRNLITEYELAALRAQVADRMKRGLAPAHKVAKAKALRARAERVARQ